MKNVHVITLATQPERRHRARVHLNAHRIDHEFFNGFDGPALGLATRFPYEVDCPGNGYIMDPRSVGLMLTHLTLWKIGREIHGYKGVGHMTIFEDDVEFVPGWRDRYALAMATMPDDWDMIFLGSCNCADKPKTEVGGGVFRILAGGPMCTHAYMIRAKALPKLIENHSRIWAPIDLALIFDSFPNLNVYTILPRLAKQHGEEISE